MDGDVGDGAVLAVEESPGRRVGAVEVECHPRIGKQLILLDYVQPAAMFARSPGVRSEPEAVDSDRVATLQRFDRHITEVPGGGMDERALPIRLCAGSPASVQRLGATEEIPAPGTFSHDQDVPRVTRKSGGRAFRQDRCEGLDDQIQHQHARVGMHAGGRLLGGKDRAGLGDDFERDEAPVVHLRVGIGIEESEGESSRRHGVREAAVNTTGALLAGTGGVDGHFVASHRHLDPYQDGILGDEIVVGVTLGFINTVRNTSDELSVLRLGGVENTLGAGPQCLHTKPIDELAVAFLTHARRRYLRIQVSHESLGRPAVEKQDVEHVSHIFALRHDARSAPTHAFLIYLGRVHRESRLRRTDIDPMCADRGKADELALVRQDTDHIDVVQVTTGDVAVVHREDISLM